MLALVTPTTFTVLTNALIRVDYDARLSWNGTIFSGRAQWDLSAAMSQLAGTVKAQVIAFAASIDGGQVTLAPSQVVIAGWGDEQVVGVRLSADQTTSSPSFVDVPGLSFLLAPNSHYKFKFKGAYTAAVGTTGLQLSVNGPASPIFMRAVGVIYTATGTPFAAAIGAYDAAIAALASGGATSLPFEVEGTISTNVVGGAFTLRARSEVNGSAVTLLRGSFGELIAVG